MNKYLLVLLTFLSVISYVQVTKAETLDSDSVKVDAGWNLMSLPVKVIDGTKNILFPSAVSSAFIYQNGYAAKDTLENGPGFWLKFDSAETIMLTGEPIHQDTVIVSVGWNIIGSLSAPVPIDSVICDPPDLIISNYFNYSGGTYQSTDTLQPGYGTWVKTKQNGHLILSGETIPVIGVPCPGMPTVNYDGKIYNTVQIRSQCWLKENLDVGTMIDSMLIQTDNSTVEKYCYNSDTANCNLYGGLYQWNEAMQYVTAEGVRGICPSGWHMPTHAEFQTLSTIVGGDGNALKALGQGTGDGAGTNTSGFSALLSGYWNNSGDFRNFGYYTNFWSSTEYGTSGSYFMYLYSNDGYINFSYYGIYEGFGFSVRCIKDLGDAPQVPEQSTPLDGADSISAPPTLIWKTTQDATSYTLQVSSDSLFSSFAYNQSGLTDTSQQIEGLSNSTKYYWRVSATNSYSTSHWSSKWSFTTGNTCPGIPTVEYEGKTYNTVQIGTQCWLKENLDVGDRIDGSQNQTNNSTIEKYCYNDDPNNCTTYGGLYQWNETMQYSTTEGAQGICPSGFHIPTLVEFQTLSTTVGGDGNSLKREDQGSEAGQGTNTNGFSALLAGERYSDVFYYDLGLTTYFLSSTEYDTDIAYNMNLSINVGGIYLIHYYKGYGFSVRCIKD